ncbi:MAG: 30S ribosomal protein S6 [Thermodesulfobacteriota bacterium]|nr:30S ribosomal protein S6 [Thermodesulfobacteriota bacterium]
MRRYETIFIADPDLQEKVQKNLFEKFTNLIDQEKGIIVDVDDWGNKKLAYEINKKSRGHYVCMTYVGTGELVKELERNFRLDDKIMKFMTILLEKEVDPEALKQEIEAAKEASKPADEPSKPAAEHSKPAEKQVETETTAEPESETEKKTDEAEKTEEEN